jgi:zinc D-Ala-D-Ala dipeptidase
MPPPCSQHIDRPISRHLTKYKIDMRIFFQEFEFRSIHRRANGVLLFLALFVTAQSLGAEELKLDLVDIKSVDPSIVIELRYAGTHNPMHRPLYPPSMAALIRPSVAQQLARAQKFLRPYKYGLKIWDAYRPKSVQNQLWQFTHNDLYVANPESGVGSLHTWGVAVDATLVDDRGRSVLMPTDFDEFTPAAMLHYKGWEPRVRSHLKLLQGAMGRNGFFGLRTEWWHFTAQNWKDYVSSRDMQVTGQSPKNKPNGKL